MFSIHERSTIQSAHRTRKIWHKLLMNVVWMVFKCNRLLFPTLLSCDSKSTVISFAVKAATSTVQQNLLCISAKYFWGHISCIRLCTPDDEAHLKRTSLKLNPAEGKKRTGYSRKHNMNHNDLCNTGNDYRTNRNLYKVITTMVIRLLDDRTYCARFAFTRLVLWRKQ